MQTADIIDRYIVGRDRKVVRVAFDRRDPDPPTPKFPGAAALRQCHNDDSAELTGNAAIGVSALG